MPITIEAKNILINFIKNIPLKRNKLLWYKQINKNIELTHEEIVVAIGIIIKPMLLK